jgi:hypothetical protein
MDRRAFVKTFAAGGFAAASLLAARGAGASSSASPTGFVDVMTHGAVPDGSSSSAAAFTAAASAAQSTGSILWIPPGTYDIQGMSPIQVGTLEILGAGRDVVTLEGASNATFLIPQANCALKLSGVSVTGFQFVVMATAGLDLDTVEITHCAFHDIGYQVFGGGGGVHYGDVGRFTFADNVATQVGAAAAFAAVVKLSADRCDHARVERNLISGVGSTTSVGQSYGIYLRLLGTELTADVKTFVLANDIRDVRQNSLPNFCSGILVDGGQTVIQGNHIQDVISSAGSAANHGIYTKCRNSVISGNTLVNAGGRPGAIMIKGSARGETEPESSPGYDVVISHNAIRQEAGTLTGSTTGITVTQEGCVISGNHITGTQRGIDVAYPAKNTLVQGNFVFGLLPHDPAGSLAGVYASSLHDCMILDNQVVGLAGAAGRYGVYVNSPGSAAGQTFRGCLIRGNWIAELTPENASSVGVQVSIGPG